MAFSPDDKFLVSSGQLNGTVKVWNARDGSLVRTLHGHTRGAWAVAVSPDSQLFATGEEAIKLWALQQQDDKDKEEEQDEEDETQTETVEEKTNENTDAKANAKADADAKTNAKTDADASTTATATANATAIRTLQGHKGDVLPRLQPRRNDPRVQFGRQNGQAVEGGRRHFAPHVG